LAARDGIEQNRDVTPVQQRVGQIDPPDAEIHRPNISRHRTIKQPPRNLDAEGIVSQEDIANAGDQYSRVVHNQAIIHHSSRRAAAELTFSTQFVAI
jgi:hypothetical protein